MKNTRFFMVIALHFLKCPLVSSSFTFFTFTEAIVLFSLSIRFHIYLTLFLEIPINRETFYCLFFERNFNGFRHSVDNMTICKECVNILGEYTPTCSWSIISFELTYCLLTGIAQFPFSFRYDEFNPLMQYSLFSFLYATMLIEGYRNFFTSNFYYYKEKDLRLNSNFIQISSAFFFDSECEPSLFSRFLSWKWA